MINNEKIETREVVLRWTEPIPSLKIVDTAFGEHHAMVPPEKALYFYVQDEDGHGPVSAVRIPVDDLEEMLREFKECMGDEEPEETWPSIAQGATRFTELAEEGAKNMAEALETLAEEADSAS